MQRQGRPKRRMQALTRGTFRLLLHAWSGGLRGSSSSTNSREQGAFSARPDGHPGICGVTRCCSGQGLILWPWCREETHAAAGRASELEGRLAESEQLQQDVERLTSDVEDLQKRLASARRVLLAISDLGNTCLVMHAAVR